MQNELILSGILEIGAATLKAGGEVSRVEDTIERLCKAYGMRDINVFSITSSIVVTVTTEEDKVISQTKRIRKYSTDFTKLEMLNSLSRSLCKEPQNETYIMNKLEEVKHAPDYPQWMYLLAYALISASFSVFFGGNVGDAISAGIIGILIRLLVKLNRRLEMNYIVSNLICSIAGGVAAALLVQMGLGNSIDKIIIGNIMLLIPGLVLVNGIRDMINGDIMSGTGRLCEAVVISMALAVGFTIALFLAG